MAILALCALPGSGQAAAASTSFNVGVTVMASCSFAIKPLLSQPEAAMRSRASLCLPPAPPLTIQAGRPRVTIDHDTGRGQMVTIEF